MLSVSARGDTARLRLCLKDVTLIDTDLPCDAGCSHRLFSPETTGTTWLLVMQPQAAPDQSLTEPPPCFVFRFNTPEAGAGLDSLLQAVCFRQGGSASPVRGACAGGGQGQPHVAPAAVYGTQSRGTLQAVIRACLADASFHELMAQVDATMDEMEMEQE
ncbi:hypothetical protein FOA52_014067 [Chlamydomonas sp. UWO 241]|nr:hypothetical protein FOA52_014067 [Chlamydomonas sp. UWO 241]